MNWKIIINNYVLHVWINLNEKNRWAKLVTDYENWFINCCNLTLMKLKNEIMKRKRSSTRASSFWILLTWPGELFFQNVIIDSVRFMKFQILMNDWKMHKILSKTLKKVNTIEGDRWQSPSEFLWRALPSSCLHAFWRTEWRAHTEALATMPRCSLWRVDPLSMGFDFFLDQDQRV